MGKTAEVPLNTKHVIEKTRLKNSIEKVIKKPLNSKLAIEKTERKNIIEKAVKIPLNTKLAMHSPGNGESLGTCLLLHFSPGAYLPSKEDLLTTFYRFGPLKVCETQLIKDTCSAQVVFVKSADAETAFHSLEYNNFPFGSTLVDYKLYHLSATCPLVEQCVTHAQPTGSIAMPGVTEPSGSMPMPMPGVIPIQPIESITMPRVIPTLPIRSIATPDVTPTQQTWSTAMPPSETPPSVEFMKQKLEMMASTMESSGHRLSPQIRAELDAGIKNLLKRVNSRLNA
ncbi:hypothetical protein JHK82_055551 [Glycine max]|uniref:Serine/threonine-protein kinase ATM n=1 Tax=Glycine soja TaxID=3848 RepID=A0A445F1L5_GLYSO|nr:hypothetical protein JHK82_055551 [Glycine max]RZB42664.1 Serine/threonine-protein kinase ATM [Glycine soja]